MLALGAGRCGLADRAGSAGFFENIGSGLQKGPRVDRAAVDTNFEMQMRAGGTAAASEPSNCLARVHAVADFGIDPAKVGVASLEAVFVADLDQTAIAPATASIDHFALRGGVNGRADGAAKINARMARRAAVKGIATIAKVGGD